MSNKCFICGETEKVKKGWFMDKAFFCESCQQYDNAKEAKKHPDMVTPDDGESGFR